MRAIAWPFISMAIAVLLLPTMAMAQTGAVVDGRVTEAGGGRQPTTFT